MMNNELAAFLRMLADRVENNPDQVTYLTIGRNYWDGDGLEPAGQWHANYQVNVGGGGEEVA